MLRTEKTLSSATWLIAFTISSSGSSAQSEEFDVPWEDPPTVRIIRKDREFVTVRYESNMDLRLKRVANSGFSERDCTALLEVFYRSFPVAPFRPKVPIWVQ